MGEFELIRQVFEPVARSASHPDLILGPGDDCAIQRVPPACELVFSVDTLVEGVHFPLHYSPDVLAHRALAVAVSDLAAMGADPVCFTLALTLPQSDAPWLRSFGKGLAAAAQAFGIALAGGDTTRGPLSLSVQVHGTVPKGQALLRSGAHPGDRVIVSGTLGDAAEALAWLESSTVAEPVERLLERYHRPTPRLSLGQYLRGKATAAIDVSDGLLADLSHILDHSGCGARIDTSRLPLSADLRAAAGERALERALYGGDDYELVFTVPEKLWPTIQENAPLPVTMIGDVVAVPGLQCHHAGSNVPVKARGYDHFGDSND